MEIVYKLTQREIDFLKALSNKSHPINSWSGRMSDDQFRKEWKDEIISFIKVELADDVSLNDTYWCYELNQKGLNLQKEYLL